MYDTHVHSTYSPDGMSDLEEYIKLFDDGKIEKLGLAEHRDFLPYCGAYGFMKYNEYTSSIKAYRDKGYEVYAGAEIDYAKKVEDEIICTLKKEAYDYTICSIHMIDRVSVSDKKNTDYLLGLKDFRVILERYYYELRASIELGIFDVIGHIGVYKRYIPKEFFEQNSYISLITELEQELAQICAKSESIIEVNTSGLFSPYGLTLADLNFIKEYYKRGGRRISVGSDAHEAKSVARGFVSAENMLKDIGFKYVYLPWDKENPLMLE